MKNFLTFESIVTHWSEPRIIIGEGNLFSLYIGYIVLGLVKIYYFVDTTLLRKVLVLSIFTQFRHHTASVEYD